MQKVVPDKPQQVTKLKKERQQAIGVISRQDKIISGLRSTYSELQETHSNLQATQSRQKEQAEKEVSRYKEKIESSRWISEKMMETELQNA